MIGSLSGKLYNLDPNGSGYATMHYETNVRINMLLHLIINVKVYVRKLIILIFYIFVHKVNTSRQLT